MIAFSHSSQKGSHNTQASASGHLPSFYLVRLAHSQYAACNFKLSNNYQYTVLAAFALESSAAPSGADLERRFKLISLATGSKCLPTSRYPVHGDALHDSHAEMLARRGVVRWLYEEVQRALHTAAGSEWIERRPGAAGKWTLRDSCRLHMYISTVPCGDASMRFLASAQDPAMAALKDAAPPAAPPAGAASRGRDGYARHGALRTKPGRADAPPTRCMACSDKIAAWGVLGVQGALAARVFAPVYVSSVIVGDVPPEMRGVVREDCERAFYRRLEEIGDLPEGFQLAKPAVCFTLLDFVHSRAALQALHPQEAPPPSSNESLCWSADSAVGQEVIINGTRRGVGARQRGLEKFRPRLCKLQLYMLCEETTKDLGTTYYEAKKSDVAFQAARHALKGPKGPFAGWVVSGKPWESFDIESHVYDDACLTLKNNKLL
ncbi:hypothetical protein DFH11DRAFT_1686674 [Phellopilus nigrolimitatus]|nr:hypothetical protein DFH11DRAFT_1686674 [Phellopilus nigrolimitatus]